MRIFFLSSLLLISHFICLSQANFLPATTLLSSDDLAGHLSYVLSDVNEDGRLDLLCGSATTLYPANNNLTFQESSIIGPTTPIAVTDFNNDGLSDILSYTHILYGMEDGTYSLQLNTPEGRNFIADFNQDGNIDVMTMGIFDLYLRLNDGTGELDNIFITSQYYTSGLTDNFDSDEFADIAVLYDSLQIDIHINNQDSSFTTTTFELDNDSSERRFTEIKCRDFDNDGISDIVGIGKGDYMFWMKNIGNGEFEPPIHFSLNHNLGAQAVLKAFDFSDFNFDGYNDLVVFMNKEVNEEAEVHVYWATQNGSFNSSDLVATAEKLNQVKYNRLEVIDYDFDGKKDIIVADNGNLLWIRNDFTLDTKIENISQKITLSPNPTQEVTILNSLIETNKRILAKVMNLDGKIVQIVNGSLPLRLLLNDNLPTGVYSVFVQEFNSNIPLGIVKLIKK